jgi:hypothetical protein
MQRRMQHGWLAAATAAWARIGAITCVCAGGGCNEALFPANAPRTQFEAYDRMRNQAAPETEMDALGRPQPALRQRLSQR